MARSAAHKKSRRKWSSTAIFLMAFVLCIVVFGVAGVWFVSRMHTADGNRAAGLSAGNAVSGEADERLFSENDAQSLLLITTLDNEAQNFLVMRLDPAATEIQVVSLPPETAVAVGTRTARLRELYGKGTRTEISQVQQAAGTVLGLSIDHYAVASYDEVEEIIAYCGNQLVFTIPEEMHYSDAESTYLRLSPGEQILSGIQVANILRYPVTYWSGGHAQHARIPAELCAAFIDQNLTPEGEKSGDAVFKDLVNLLSSNDLLISHYYQAQAALTHLAEENDGSICRVVSIEGEYVGSGATLTFYPSETLSWFS